MPRWACVLVRWGIHEWDGSSAIGQSEQRNVRRPLEWLADFLLYWEERCQRLVELLSDPLANHRKELP
jgi:hypothetical protein